MERVCNAVHGSKSASSIVARSSVERAGTVVIEGSLETDIIDQVNLDLEISCHQNGAGPWPRSKRLKNICSTFHNSLIVVGFSST